MYESQAEHLQKDSKNTQRPPHQSMTIKTLLVMTYLLTILALWAGKTKMLQDPSKRPFLSE